jgi:formylglycine-generating enzyme
MKARDGMTPEEAADLQGRRWMNQTHLGDIHLQVSLEMGRRQVMLSEVQQIKEQDVIELEKLAGEAFEIRVNDHVFALGEIVAVADVMACRVTELCHPVSSEEFNRPLKFAEPEGESSEQIAEVEEPGGGDADAELGSEFIFIPSGPFVMGGGDEDTPRNERPAHMVHLSAYFINRYPVTNQEYLDFVRGTGHRAPIHWERGTYPTGTGQHPVVNVSWQDARDYAAWTGARLPTEAEWEKAARGTDERHYPWGNRFVDGERCNGNNSVGTTTPANEYPDGRSPYGVWDMCGNVCEWCADYYDEDFYKISPGSDPRGPDEGQERVVRGGSFGETRSALRVTHRAGISEVSSRENTGFRIVMDV